MPIQNDNEFNFEEQNKDINNISFYDNHFNSLTQIFSEDQEFNNYFCENYTNNENDIYNEKKVSPTDEEINSCMSPQFKPFSIDEEINPFATEGMKQFFSSPIFPGTPFIKNEKETSIISNSSDKDTHKENNNKMISKKRGKNLNESKHNKYYNDNMRRKTKHIFLTCLLGFINKIICKIYNNKIGKGICEKKYKKLNLDIKIDTTKGFNKKLLYKTLEEIFSSPIAFYPIDFNKNLTKNLMNEPDISKRNHFQNLFRLTFLDCLKHFRGDEYHIELDGMNTMDNEIQKYSSDLEYIDNLKYYFKNYENILYNKKSWKKKQRSNIIDNSNFNSIINY